MVYSSEYFPLCDSKEELNMDVWRIALFSPRLGPLTFTEVWKSRGEELEEEELWNDGVCSRCGVPDGTYDSFEEGGCNCSD